MQVPKSIRLRNLYSPPYGRLYLLQLYLELIYFIEFLFDKFCLRDVGLGLSLLEAGGYRNNASKSLGVIILMP
jgi:hypothetical protein